MKYCPTCGSDVVLKTFRKRKAYARTWIEYVGYSCTNKKCLFSMSVADYKNIIINYAQEVISDAYILACKHGDDAAEKVKTPRWFRRYSLNLDAILKRAAITQEVDK